MALLSIIDAVRLTGVSRAQLYRYIKAGRISRTAEGFLDTAELLRAGLMLRLTEETETVSMRHDETPPVSSDVSAVSHPAQERLIAILERELAEARLLLREAHDRETQLIQMLSQIQQQNQRLLDMPRIPPETHQDAPGRIHAPTPVETRPEARQPLEDVRGAMRRRILALLRTYRQGLTPAEIRDLLGVDHNLGDTLLGMLRYGLVRRVGRGRYVVR